MSQLANVTVSLLANVNSVNISQQARVSSQVKCFGVVANATDITEGKPAKELIISL